MVCLKDKELSHDFDKDPIPAYIDGGWIRSHGTTLGADNGVGLAMAMAAAEEDSPHGPLLILATMDEETGLTGATNLDAGLFLPTDRFLINLDTEDVGEIYVSCAGGGDAVIRMPVCYEDVSPRIGVTVTLGSCTGGHSGADIHLGRANAIRLTALLLNRLLKYNPWKDLGGVRLAEIDGGQKSNAIPRECKVYMGIPDGQLGEFFAWFNDQQEAIARDYGATDPDANITISVAMNKMHRFTSALTVDSAGILIDLLLELRDGVVEMSNEIPGLVQTSNNTAIVSTRQGVVEITCSSRSSKQGSLSALRDGIVQTAIKYDAAADLKPSYPGWPVDPNSVLVKVAKSAWRDLTDGKDAEVKAVHAGLECGVLLSRAASVGIALDAVSIGATVKNPHSPSECLQISTVGESYAHLINILRGINRL